MAKPLHLNLLPNTNLLHNGLGRYQVEQGRSSEHPTQIMDLYLEYGKLAEAGMFTSFFLADTPGALGTPIADAGSPEPVTALTAVAGVTRHLGLIATMSTTFYDPYNVARLIGSLDLISNGRAGVNAVTSSSDISALNYSLDKHPDRDVRYARADEFLTILGQLFRNREVKHNDFGNPQLFGEPIDYKGRFFSVRGPLNVAPSRQGAPVIAQAGASGQGVIVGAKHADLIFTNANSKGSALRYRDELNKALVAVGRRVDSVPVLPGVTPYLGRTSKEAHELKEELDSYLDHEALAPDVLKGFGIEYSYTTLDDPFPLADIPQPEEIMNEIKSAYGNYLGLYNWIKDHPGVTVRQVASQTAGGGFSHRKFIGSYDEFVDDMIDWVDSGAVEGFTVIPALGIPSLRAVVDEVVPRLIDRGVYPSTPDNRPLKQRFTAAIA